MRAPPESHGRSLPVAVLKPDALGDFILATGAIGCLAEAVGEAALVLAVRREIAPLARAQFPQATVCEMPLRDVRRFFNVTAVNLAKCAPVWARWCLRSYAGVLALRSMRSYLQSFFFFGPPARMRVGCANPLVRGGSRKRGGFERWASLVFRPTLLPYPEPSMEFPSELEANRRVLGAFLERRVERREVYPRLCVSEPGEPRGWLLSPFSSTPVKDLPARRWAEALGETHELRSGGEPLRLAGSPAQKERLEAFARELAECGLRDVVLEEPCGVDLFTNRVASARLVLTVDTAAAHYACALGVPAVIASSGKHPGVYGPYSPDGRQIWVFPDAPGDGKKGKSIDWHKRLPATAVPAAIRAALAAQ